MLRFAIALSLVATSGSASVEIINYRCAGVWTDDEAGDTKDVLQERLFAVDYLRNRIFYPAPVGQKLGDACEGWISKCDVFTEGTTIGVVAENYFGDSMMIGFDRPTGHLKLQKFTGSSTELYYGYCVDIES